MTQKTFQDYKNDFLVKANEIEQFQYTSNGVEKTALNKLQIFFKNIVLPSHSDSSQRFEEIQEEIRTAKREFTSVAGEAQYTYKSLPDSWHEGFEKTLKPGKKNEMLASIEFCIERCLYYIQTMISMKYVEERTTHGHGSPPLAHVKTLLLRMQKLLS
jgi:hypothetical protein